MDTTTRSNIRHIFLSPRPNFALLTAAGLLRMPFVELKREIGVGTIVAVSTGMGQRVAREELMALALERFGLDVVEEALGEEAAGVLPEAMRLVELRARVPRYQRDVLRFLAQRDGTSVDAVLRRELEDVVCAHADEVARVLPEVAGALAWPSRAGRAD
ncbi:MAG TPA: hypothetical protein VF618_01990 [Thermoanaerobaculia bacterium]